MSVAAVTSINKRQSAMGPARIFNDADERQTNLQKTKNGTNLGLAVINRQTRSNARLPCLHTRAGDQASLFRAPTLAL